MDIQQLRKIISDCPKFPGAKIINPAPVCNNGFPGTFNLSFTEPEWIREFGGQYLDYDHDFIYSKIQPCIRHQDWSFIKNHKEEGYRYLSVFDMADVGGAVSVIDRDRLDEIAEFSATSLFSFLVGQLELSPERLRIKYCAGASVATLTKQKYPLEKILEADSKIELWRRLGIKENQFIQDRSRDTLLALHIYDLPTPWGYRNEIFYEHQGKLLDIGTFEYLFLRPIFDADGSIKDLRRWEHCFVVSAIGIERILMVLNNHKDIMKCSHIEPLCEMILNDAREKISNDANVLAQGIRAIHRIISDAGQYSNLSKHRKQKIRDYYNGIFNSSIKLKIDITAETSGKYLRKNAKLQSYYPELTQSLELTIAEVSAAKARFTNDKSIKKLGV